MATLETISEQRLHGGVQGFYRHPSQACTEAGQSLRLRRRAGYDHSYWFITSFIDDHLRHHAHALGLL